MLSTMKQHSETCEMEWEKRLDAFFRGMNEYCNQRPIVKAPDQEAATLRRPDAPIQGLHCPLHDYVRLERQTSAEGTDFVECSERNCPISLAWDHNLPYVISKVTGRLDPNENFFCGCGEVSKVGLIENADSPDRGRCYLSCKQPVKCKFHKWID